VSRRARRLCGGSVAVLLAIAAQGAAAADRFEDPAPYCRHFRTVDKPGAHYVGPPVPDWVAAALRRAAGARADAPLEFFRRARWRCAGGRVMACLYGNNIPCDAKADRRRTPGPGLLAFCRDNPSAAIVPIVATGRTTVYAWRCRDGKPVIERQVLAIDERGYAASFWFRVDPD
jgi:hypothetical protein